MKDTELKELYRTACAGKGFEPSDGQFKIWKQTLGWIEMQDLEAALTAWYADNQSFPMPAALKPLAMSNKQRRETRISQPLDLVRWRCHECKITMTGFIPPYDEGYRRCRGIPRDGKYDQNYRGEKVCGAQMVMESRITNHKSDDWARPAE
jgi:hypothetical protein